MNVVSQFCLALLTAATISAAATESQVELEYTFPVERLHLPPNKPDTLWERFEFAIERNTERVFKARFHPLNMAQWHLLSDADAAAYREQVPRLGRNAMTRSVTTAAREVAFELPVMIWLDGQRSFLADFLLNSVDAVEEESVAPLDPNYRVLERSWWKRLSDSRNLRFGVRPFRTSPYAFMSASVWNGDSLLMLTHVRYHFRNFADHHFEMAVSLPLTHGFAMDVGTAYHMTRRDDFKHIVLKLSKQFADGGIVHIGMEAEEKPRFVVGITMPL